MKKTTIMLSIILIAIIITGCTTTSNVVKETKQRPIKIGLFAPLTGSAASWGQNVLAGAQLAVNEVNSQGGINGRKVILIAEDDKCSVEGATAVKKLIEYDRVDAIVGSVCSAAAEPAVPIAQQEKIPVVLTIASAPELTINRDYIFRNYPSNNYFGKAIAEYSYNILEKRKAAVLYSQNSYGTSIKDVFVKEFKKAGGEVVFIQGINDNQKDFKTEIAKIKNPDADFLYIPI